MNAEVIINTITQKCQRCPDTRHLDFRDHSDVGVAKKRGSPEPPVPFTGFVVRLNDFVFGRYTSFDIASAFTVVITPRFRTRDGAVEKGCGNTNRCCLAYRDYIIFFSHFLDNYFE